MCPLRLAFFLSAGQASKLIPPTHLWCAPGSGRRHTVLGTTCGKAAAERKPQTLERAPGAAAEPGRRVSGRIWIKANY